MIAPLGDFEPLVWAAADTFELVPGASLPLALYREHSVSREAALDAVRDSERAWHIAYTSPSLTGVRAAALAGLAVTPLPASAVGRGLRTLGEKDGMPPLPDLDLAIFERPRPGPAAAALAAALALLRPAHA
jgi:DNA-binding transcriptional LysR family regulator